MASLEVVQNIFSEENYTIVTPESDAYAANVAATFKAVAADPTGFITIHGKSSAEKHVPHKTMPGVKLQVVIALHSNQWPPNIEGVNEAHHPISTYWQMGVIEQRGMMTFGVEKQRVKEVNFNDPYIEMIIEYFRSHLQAGN